MSQYYLMAQLPSLDALGDSSPLPITEERFYDLCSRFLDKKSLCLLNSLSLTPKADTGSTKNAFIDKWNSFEVNLRLALGRLRAEKMNKSFEVGDASIDHASLQAAQYALTLKDPMEAEIFLCTFRLRMLEDIRPTDSFSESAVYYYALKLKLLSRMRAFDTTVGEQKYKNIYNSIINKNEGNQEAAE